LNNWNKKDTPSAGVSFLLAAQRFCLSTLKSGTQAPEGSSDLVRKLALVQPRFGLLDGEDELMNLMGRPKMRLQFWDLLTPRSVELQLGGV
jgi:hypothetical protein